MQHQDDTSTVVRKGTSALLSCFARDNTGTLPIVPLSSGLDSRAILGGLLAHYRPHEITTVTFGVPGTWDFDIGSKIADGIGTNHIPIDLSKIEIERDELIRHAVIKGVPLPVIDSYLYSQIFEQVRDDGVYWIGHMGGALSGIHVDKDSLLHFSWSDAVKRFITSNAYAEIELAQELQQDIEGLFPPQPFVSPLLVAFDDQLNLCIRQHTYLARLLTDDRVKTRTPFLDSAWLAFILSVPPPLRQSRFIYKRLLAEAFPLLMRYPTNRNKGLAINAPRSISRINRALLRRGNWLTRAVFQIIWTKNPNEKYLPYGDLLRTDQRFRQLIQTELGDLKDRDVVDWVDTEEIWELHMSGSRNLTRTILSLFSTEIYLKAQDRT